MNSFLCTRLMEEDSEKLFSYKPKLFDVIRIFIHPDKHFVRNPKNPEQDLSMYVYNEFTENYKKTCYPIGIIVEIFKNRRENETWVTIYNRFDGFEYSVPIYNIVEKI